MSAPVMIYRSREYGCYEWVIKHRGDLVATFTSGQRALAYVDNELRAWEHQQRAKPVNWAPLIAAIAKGIASYNPKKDA